MATRRRAIRNAIVAAANTITIANSYAVEIANNVTEPTRVNDITEFPEVQWLYGEETRRHNELHRKKAFLHVEGVIYTRGSASKSAEEECDEIIESLEDVFEATIQPPLLGNSGTLLGLGYVEDVLVDGILPFPIDSGEHAGICRYIISVLVSYRYTRSSA